MLVSQHFVLVSAARYSLSCVGSMDFEKERIKHIVTKHTHIHERTLIGAPATGARDAELLSSIVLKLLYVG